MQYILVSTVGQAVSDVIISLSLYSIISLKVRSTIATAKTGLWSAINADLPTWLCLKYSYGQVGCFSGPYV